jgi:hypothetical protein
MIDSCYLPKRCEKPRVCDGRDITRSAKLCQHISLRDKKLDKDPAFAQRLREAFDGAKDAEIARKLGYRSQSPITKFMSGVYPETAVLIDISRVTKRSIHWLLTGEGDADLNPLRFLSETQRAIVQKVADNSNQTVEETVATLVEAALLARGAAMFAQSQADLEPNEIDELRLMFRLYQDENGQETGKRKSTKSSTSRAS